MKIGIYGGTFDPIHCGHLNLAQQMLEIHQLDEVWFCPVHISPHKLDEKAASVEHRLAMVNLAIAPFSRFKLLGIEAEREGPSYTIETLHWLLKNHPDDKFNFILGGDSISRFSEWKEPEEIMKFAPLLVGPRACNAELVMPPGVSITPLNVMEISATEIRERTASNQPIHHLVPFPVADYIQEKKVYFP